MKFSKKQTFDINRRRFLNQSAGAATGAAIALASGKKSWYAWADAQAQHPRLVTVHLPGGWDTNWFHMAFPKSMISSTDNQNLIKNLPSKYYDQSLPLPGGQGDPFGRRVDLDALGNNNITQFYRDIYTERTRSNQLVPHRNAPGHYLGLGMQNAFGGGNLSGGVGLDVFFKRVCVWKGLDSGALHDIPNKNILHGNDSQYSICYSGLIAQSLASRFGRLPLNYLQLTSTPTEFGSNWAMAKGDQVPINCVNHSALKGLTSRSPQDFSDGGLYSALNSSISQLGDQIGKERFSLSASKQVFAQFMAAFNGTISIAQLGATMDTSFLKLWANYANYALGRVQMMHQPGFINLVSPEVLESYRFQAYNYHLYAPFSPGITPLGEKSPMLAGQPGSPYATYQSEINTLNAALTTPFTADEASLNLNWDANMGLGSASLRAAIAMFSWKFAVTNYMISNNYSNVIDIALNTYDAHGDNSSELRLMTIIFSLYAKLLADLDANQVLDSTSVVMFSEFDRTSGLQTQLGPNNRGTAHDNTCSILLAGYGFKQGSVVGDRLYNNVKALTTPDNSQLVNGVPINYRYVFPTIMKAFGVEIPANQLTEGSAIQSVLA